MDNFRVPRPSSVRPRQAVDGFTRATAARQTPREKVNTAYSSVEAGEPSMVAGLQEADFAQPVYVPEAAVQPAPPPVEDTPEEVQAVQVTPFDLEAIEDANKPKNRLSPRRTFKKWLLRSGIATTVVVIAVGGTLFVQGLTKVHKVFRGTDGKVTALSAGATQQLLKGESTGRVNFLLLGNGGDGHQAPDLTDTMIVESVDVVHKTAVMLSVPRDLWVQVPKAGNMKINAAYEVGKYNYMGKIDDSNANTNAVEAGFAQADQAVKTVLGLDIDYNVLVNFTSFKQAINAVGGVTVNVPTALVDPTMAWENGNNPILAAAGTQQMDGKQALLYARSRETSSDFARSERQRSIILALKDKVLTAGTLSNPVRISQLINAFGDNLVTDMSLSEGMRAYNIGKEISNDKITSLDLVTPPGNLITTGNMNGTSIDQPRAGLFQYGAIQQYIQQALTPAPASSSSTLPSAPAAENAQISILNGTNISGLASAKANVVKTAGYNAATVGNAPTRTYTKTVVVDLSNGADPNTKSYLETTFGTTSVTALPAGVTAGGANFVVILGSEQSL